MKSFLTLILSMAISQIAWSNGLLSEIQDFEFFCKSTVNEKIPMVAINIYDYVETQGPIQFNRIENPRVVFYNVVGGPLEIPVLFFKKLENWGSYQLVGDLYGENAIIEVETPIFLPGQFTPSIPGRPSASHRVSIMHMEFLGDTESFECERSEIISPIEPGI